MIAPVPGHRPAAPAQIDASSQRQWGYSCLWWRTGGLIGPGSLTGSEDLIGSGSPAGPWMSGRDIPAAEGVQHVALRMG